MAANSERLELLAERASLTKELRALRYDEDGHLRPRFELVRGDQGQHIRDLQEAIRSIDMDLLILEPPPEQRQPFPSPATPDAQGSRSACRMPPDVPTFDRSSSKSTPHPDSFLRSFESKLRANGYPKDCYLVALHAQCGELEQPFIEALIDAGKPWSESRALFISHFSGTSARALARAQLEEIAVGPSEPLAIFADRYQKAALNAGVSLEDDDRVEHVLVRLNRSDSSKATMLRAACVANPALKATTRRLLEAVAAMYPLAADAYSRKGQASKSDAVPAKWCDFHKSSSHNTSDCKRTSKSKMKQPHVASAQRPPQEKSAKWCDHHHSAGHNTSECRARAATQAGGAVSQPPQSGQVRAQPKRPYILKCHKCGLDGHIAVQCKAQGTAPTRFSRESADDSETVISTPEEFARFFDEAPPSTSLYTRELPQSSPDHSTALFVPLEMNGTSYQAYIDSGASNSCVDTSIAKQLPRDSFQPPPAGSKVSLGSRGVFVDRMGSIAVPIRYGEQRITHRFDVADTPEGISVIIGRDLMAPLGIAISGLLTPAQHEATPNPSADQKATMFDDKAGEHPLRHHPDLEAALARNQAIPHDSFCSVPDAVVRLDTGDAPPVWNRQYRIAHNLEELVDKQVAQWLQRGKIRTARPGCPYNLSLLVASKRDYVTGERKPGRVCLDPRRINAVTKSVKYESPKISDIFAFLAPFRIFSGLDLEQSFLQLRIHEPDQDKVSFTWRGHHYSFVGTPFGLIPTSAVLQRTMESVFTGSQCAKPFQDDVPVGSADADQHLRDLIDTISRLTRANLRVNVRKSHFFRSAIHLLGHTISGGGVTIDRRKLKTVLNWPRPTTGNQIEKYLGLINFFRDFIPLYSHVAAPLESLRKVPQLSEIHWTAERNAAFRRLKDILLHGLFLSFPDFDKPFHMAHDASTGGIAATLYQLKKDEPDVLSNRAFILFAARALHAGERNYSATKLELLSLVYGLKRFHYYLYNSSFTCYTDHKALTFLFSQKQPNPLMAGWYDTILSFPAMKLIHRPGILNLLPDTLSRLFPARRGLMSASQRLSTPCRFSCEQQQRVPSPLTKEAQRQAVESSHLKGHFGAQAIMADLAAEGLQWPGMRQDVLRFVSTCQPCQRFTVVKRGYHPLRPYTASMPWDAIAVDTALSFPTSPRGNNVLLVVVCLYTRFVLLRAVPDKSAASIAMALFSMFCDFGFPRILISDNGAEFVNQLVAHMVENCGIDHRLTTAYHPRANGTAERYVGTATRAIRKLLQGEDRAWDTKHHGVQLFLNLKIAARHQSRPFSVMFNRAHNLFQDFSGDSSIPAEFDLNTVQKRLNFATDILYPAIRDKTATNMSKAIHQFAKHKKILKEPFPVGSMVMVKDPTRSSKLEPYYLGPFKVLRKNRGGAYLLLDSDATLFQRAVAPEALKLVRKDPKHDEVSYVVEKILKHRGPQHKREYLVRWKSMPSSEDSWEPAENFNELDCLRRYWSKKPLSPSEENNVVLPPSATQIIP